LKKGAGKKGLEEFGGTKGQIIGFGRLRWWRETDLGGVGEEIAQKRSTKGNGKWQNNARGAESIGPQRVLKT